MQRTALKLIALLYAETSISPKIATLAQLIAHMIVGWDHGFV